MPTITRKSSVRRATAQKRAAEKAQEAADVLHSLASSLALLDSVTPVEGKPKPTPRNWWKLQAGRFKNDSTFSDFVAQVQASRKREG